MTAGEKKKRLRGSKTQYHFFSFYFIFLIVLVVMLLVFMNITSSLLTEKTVHIAREMLQNGMTELELTLQSYASAASLFYGDKTVYQAARPVSDQTPYYTVWEAQKNFRGVTSAMSKKADCGVFLSNGVVLMPSRFFVRQESLVSAMLACREYEYGAWLALLQESHSGTLLPAAHYALLGQPEYQALTYVLRGSVANNNADSVFFVTIRVEDLLSMLTPADSMLEGSLTLYNAAGEQLLTAGAGGEAAGSPLVTVRGASGMSAGLHLSDGVVAGELAAFRRFAGAFLVLYVLFGLAAAWIFALRNSRPVVALLRAATRLDRSGQPPEEGQAGERAWRQGVLTEEYRYIMSVLADSGVALQSYERELERQAQQARYYAFASLLGAGAAPGGGLTDSLFAKGASYRLLLVRPLQAGEGGEAPEAPEGGQDTVGTLLLSILKPCLPPDSLCCLAQGDAAALIREEPDFPGELLQNVGRMLGERRRLRCLLAVSESCRDAQDVGNAYAQLSYLLQFPAARDPEGVVRMPPEAGEYTRSERRDKLLSVSYAYLYHQLLSGRHEAVAELLDECAALVRQDDYVEPDIVQYVFRACTCALLELRRNFPAISDAVVVPAYRRDEGIGVLFATLGDAFTQAGRRLGAYYEHASRQRALEIVQFIHENLANPALYTKLVTSRFSITEADLQAMFRGISGLSFFAYVEQARMRLAKEMVMESDKPFREIGEACGYNSNIAFSRAFKRFYGCAPSQMRGNGAAPKVTTD